MEGKATIDVAYGVAATGTWVPPWIDDFGLFANLDAQLDGILSINANANVSIMLFINWHIFERFIGQHRNWYHPHLHSQPPRSRLCWVRDVVVGKVAPPD